MGEIIKQLDIKREKDYLYYVAFSPEGFLMIGKSKLKRGGTKKNGWRS